MKLPGIPLVNTPFGVLVVFTAFAALLRRKAVGRWLYSSSIFAPLSMLVVVLLIFGLIGYGDPEAIAFRVRTYLMGMWPLVLAWLILKTPEDAKAVLLVALVANLILAVEVLWIITTQGQDMLANIASGYNVRHLVDDQKISLSYLTMMALALCAPIWLSLLLDGGLGPKLKLLVGGALGATAVCVLLSTYSSAVMSLIVGICLVFVARWRRVQGRRLQIIGGFVLAGLLLVGGSILADNLPSVQNTLNRIRNPQEDSSGAYRIMGIWEESKAFLESPLIGHGVAGEEKLTKEGHLLVGHNSITRDAASFGLLFVVPFLAVLAGIGHQYLRLQKKVLVPVDAAVLSGMFVSFLVSIAGGMITCTFGDLTQDTYFWTFTSVILFWNRWADSHPGIPFFAWRSTT